MGALWQDLRYGLRMLFKSPGFTMVAILTLALGIGANSAIFSVIHSVLLRPLPYKDSDRLVWAWGNFYGGNQAAISPPDFLDYRAQNHVFEHFTAFNVYPAFNLTGVDPPERVSGVLVSADFFQALGVNPIIGRAFLPDEEKPDRSQVVILSHGFWQRRFGADPNLLNKTITLNGKGYMVIGILPLGFQYFQRVELWAPLVFEGPEMRMRRAHFLRGIARLKPGVTLRQAQTELDTIARRLEQQYPDSNKSWSLRLVTLHERIVGNIRRALLVLLGAVGFVLLIACVNVANLLLVRAAARQKEIAIRAALGAGRLRVIRQLLTESVLLALLAGVLGFLLALWGTDLLVALSPGNIPRAQEIRMDMRVLSFTLLISLLAGMIFGLAPALQAARPDLNESLKEGSRSSTDGSRRQRARSLLIVSEIALALVLLIGAGLTIKSFLRLQQVNPGFNSRNILTMAIALPPAKYSEPAKVAAFYQQMLQRVEALPGVQSVGVVSQLPLSGQYSDTSFVIEGRPPQAVGEKTYARMPVVSSNYFRVMNIPLLKGRHFTEAEAGAVPKSAIINERMAQRFFPQEDPIGKRLIVDMGTPSLLEIVGVAGNVRHIALDVEPMEEMYVATLMNPVTNLIVRTATDPTRLSTAVQKEIQAIDKDQPVSNVRTIEQLLDGSVASARFRTLLLGLFAAVALALAAIGIYGVMAYSVTQRRHEIGVRMALGAQPKDVLKWVVGEGMRLALIGVAIGLTGAWALTRVLSNLLYEVSATDPATFAGLSLLLASVALVASYIPARQATRVDPMVALRYE